MTPIGEIPLDEVTKAEADAYGRWRDGYQRNWSWAFDPIALRISLGKEPARGRHDRDAADLRAPSTASSSRSRRAASSPRTPAIRTTPWPISSWP